MLYKVKVKVCAVLKQHQKGKDKKRTIFTYIRIYITLILDVNIEIWHDMKEYEVLDRFVKIHMKSLF